MDQPGNKGCQSCSWSAEQGMMNIPLSPYVPEKLVSRDGFSRPVPRQPAHFHSQAESGAYSRDSSRFTRRRPYNIFLNRYKPSGQSQVYRRVTQLHTNGVHCRESVGTGPVVLKIVPNGRCHFTGHHGPVNARLSFPHPLLA